MFEPIRPIPTMPMSMFVRAPRASGARTYSGKDTFDFGGPCAGGRERPRFGSPLTASGGCTEQARNRWRRLMNSARPLNGVSGTDGGFTRRRAGPACEPCTTRAASASHLRRLTMTTHPRMHTVAAVAFLGSLVATAGAMCTTRAPRRPEPIRQGFILSITRGPIHRRTSRSRRIMPTV